MRKTSHQLIGILCDFDHHRAGKHCAFVVENINARKTTSGQSQEISDSSNQSSVERATPRQPRPIGQ